MDVVSLKAGHDGSVAFVRDNTLMFCHESEKDSFDRHAEITPELLLSSFDKMPRLPDVIVDSGWAKSFPLSNELSKYGAGYRGVSSSDCSLTSRSLFGKQVQYYSCTHERSHIMCSYALSPQTFRAPCAVLVWEGTLGDFYLLNEDMSIAHLGTVRDQIGNIYCLPYWIANTDKSNPFSLGIAGKAMALAAYGKESEPTGRERDFAKFLANDFDWRDVDRTDFSTAPCFKTGVRSLELSRIMNALTEEIFSLFHKFALSHVPAGLPLLIAGGCGLNCQWNDWWANSSHFRDVFVPPCCNDSGIAIGAAADALRYFGMDPRLNWTCDSGPPFVWDIMPPSDTFEQGEFKPQHIANLIAQGEIIAWVQGNSDIGPRSLGSRSLLARPQGKGSRERLNALKLREDYRPIAPVCLEEVAPLYFEGRLPSQYMLYFHRCINSDLEAVTHVDGSSRVQTVGLQERPALRNLLEAYGRTAGTPVLCNTSLNFPGLGFINRTSDLLNFVARHNIKTFVIDDRVFSRAVRSGS